MKLKILILMLFVIFISGEIALSLPKKVAILVYEEVYLMDFAYSEEDFW